MYQARSRRSLPTESMVPPVKMSAIRGKLAMKQSFLIMSFSRGVNLRFTYSAVRLQAGGDSVWVKLGKDLTLFEMTDANELSFRTNVRNLFGIRIKLSGINIGHNV